MSTFHALTRRAFAGFMVAAAAGLLATDAGAQGLQEGKNYFRLKSPQPVETGKKIEVLEFFSYGCPHCADLDPELQAWQKTLPADVSFRRVPVMFQDRWIGLAKVFFTLEALGVDDRLTPEVFVALHKNGAQLWNEKAFFDWAASKGLDRKKVEEMYGSFAINGKVNRAKQLAQAYNVQSVPMVVVDGKFTTASDKVGSHAAMPAALNELIAKARTERPKS
jgi:protein dithiol oxidoreductase (disulfide-forming)